MTSFDQALIQVINDKQSGSVAILQQLIRGILSYLVRETDPIVSFNTLSSRMPLMRGALSHFAVVSHFLTNLEAAISKIPDHGFVKDELFDFVVSYDNKWKNANAGVAKIADENLDCNGKTILLHSNSSVITSFFSRLSKQNVNAEIILTESRPENEGRYQAEMLAGLGYHVSYIVDAAVGFMMDRVDLVLLGADQIHKNYFVNKIGTYAIALFCREKGKQLHVLADSRKIVRATVDPASLYNVNRPGDDIWKTTYQGIHPVNYYFEPIPTLLVTSFITENSVIKSSDLINS